MARKDRRRLVEEEAHFVEVGAQSVRSDRGFEVAFVGRFELLYKEGERSLIIPVDPLFDRLLVEFSRAVAWAEPHAAEVLTTDDRERIVRSVESALKRLRLGFERG